MVSYHMCIQDAEQQLAQLVRSSGLVPRHPQWRAQGTRGTRAKATEVMQDEWAFVFTCHIQLYCVVVLCHMRL